LAVYNSQWMAREAEDYYAGRPSAPAATLVVRPPVFADNYRTTPGDAITLINCNADKSGDLFWRIAKRMPDHKFPGVRGASGQQVAPPPPVPNLAYPGHALGRARSRAHVW